MTRNTLFSTLILLATTACRNALPCPDCDDEADDQDEQADETLSDLPCGGADLLTDNFNCGTCGNECLLYYPNTPYESGGCQEGVCGPGWTHCQPGGLNPIPNCAEICDGLGHVCVANGCAGYTAMVHEVSFDGGCDPTVKMPAVLMDGACDEPIPWMGDPEWIREVSCCCDFQ